MKKISHKLIFGMIALTALATITIWIYQIAFLETNYMERRLSVLGQAMEVVSKLYENNNMNELEYYAEDLFYTSNITTEIIAMDGTVLYVTGNMMGRGYMISPRVLKGTYFDTLITTGIASSTVPHVRLNTEVFTVSKIIGDNKGILTGSMPIEPIKETINILKKQLFYISIILLLLSIIIGTFISRVFLKPIRSLNESVNALARGDMQARVDVTSMDEIGALSRNFNQMAGELSKIDRLRKDLVANVSHELRTPLGIIKGYTEMTRDIHGEDKEKREHNLDIIIKETDRLSDVVSDILNLSQIESGYMPIEKKRLDIVELAKTTLSKFKLMATKKKVSLVFQIEGEAHDVYADPKRIEQVFHNLISNAIQNTGDGGQVYVNIKYYEQEVTVEIEDTGIGIPPGQLDSIWDRYYKVHSEEGHAEGTGLGLSIVKSILEAHQLTYGVTSVLGQGSIFYFTLPLYNNK